MSQSRQRLMVATPIDGEDGRYMVVGRTLFCRGECRFSYQPRPDSPPRHAAGDPCPKCGEPLAPLEYLCDLALYNGLGKCGCHRWQFYIQPMVNRMTAEARTAARETDDLRCDHLVAAMRKHALVKIDERHAGSPQTPAEEPS